MFKQICQSPALIWKMTSPKIITMCSTVYARSGIQCCDRVTSGIRVLSGCQLTINPRRIRSMPQKVKKCSGHRSQRFTAVHSCSQRPGMLACLFCRRPETSLEQKLDSNILINLHKVGAKMFQGGQVHGMSLSQLAGSTVSIGGPHNPSRG